MIHKYQVELWFKNKTGAGDYVRITKSTDNTITMNAETEDRDYIADENPTTVLKKYKPSLSQPIAMEKGSADYELCFANMFDMKVGSDAEVDMLVVFKAHSEDGIKAWRTDALFVIDNMNPVDETITATVNFNGTVEKGTVTYGDSGVPVFEAAA